MLKQNMSFRGNPIPEVFPKSEYTVADSQTIVDKINSMTEDQRQEVTIDAAYFEKYKITDVRLTTGDIISVETAIALASNNMLSGYSTGATMNGGRTLRSKPSYEGIYNLPRF